MNSAVKKQDKSWQAILPNVVSVVVLAVAEGVTKVIMVGVPPLVAGCKVVRPVLSVVRVSKTGSKLRNVTIVCGPPGVAG